MTRTVAAALALLLAAAAADAALLARNAGSGPAPSALKQLLSSSRLIGPTDAYAALSLTLTLRGRDAGGLQKLLKSGRTLTPKEFDALYSPAPAQVEAALERLRAAGVQPAWTPGSTLVALDATAGALERLLGVSFRDYVAPDGTPFYAPDRDAILPGYLHAVASGVSGLDSYFRYHKHAIRPGGMTPDDVLAFYNIKALRDRG